MPGWALYGVLYLLFAGVTLWLAAEALIQHGAPVLYRMLALAGFVGLWAGIVLKINLAIYGGLALFVVAQLIVTVYVRKGAHRAWALGGGKGRRGRREGGRPTRADGGFEPVPTEAAAPSGDEADFDPDYDFDPSGGFDIPLGEPDPFPAASADFDTQVGLGFGPGLNEPSPGPAPAVGMGGGAAPGPAAHAQPAAPERTPAGAGFDPAETPVISPFVDDAYAREAEEEYDSAPFAGSAEATEQFPSPFAAQPPAVPPGLTPPTGAGPDGASPWPEQPAETTWLDTYVSPRAAAAERHATDSGAPPPAAPAVERSPSVWDTYERRIRLPNSGQNGTGRHAARPDVPRQADAGPPGFPTPQPPTPAFERHDARHQGAGQFGVAPPDVAEPAFPAPPAPWPRLPEQPQPGQAPAFGMQSAPPPRGHRGPAHSSETLIGQIVSDEDTGFPDDWASEQAPSFGGPRSNQPTATFEPPADEPGWAAADPEGWDGGEDEPEAGQPPGGGRHGAARHGRGRRRGRR